MIRSLTLAILALCLCTSLALAADWPHFLGPSSNAMAPDTGINTDWAKNAPKVLWNVPLTGGGFAGPSVAAGKVFIIDHQGKQDIVRALDLQTGADIWQYPYDDTDKPNGGSYGFAMLTPTIDNGKVYTVSHLGVVHCLDMQKGTLIWTRNLVADFDGKLPMWNLATSPFIDKDKLIVQPGGKDAAVVALNKLTGETIWKGGGSSIAGYATPFLTTINDQAQYIIFTMNEVEGVDTQTGATIWSFPWKTGCDVNAATPIVIGNSVFITSDYGHGAALIDVAPDNTAKARWAKHELPSRFTTPVFADGYLYTTTDNNRLVCVDANTGDIKWQQPGFELGGLVGVDGKLIVMDGKTGDMAMINMTPAGYQELGRIRPLGGQSWTAPIISDGKLIVRNLKSIACIDIK